MKHKAFLLALCIIMCLVLLSCIDSDEESDYVKEVQTESDGGFEVVE